MIERWPTVGTGPPLEISGVNRIVVLRALHLGDFLCSVPALRALKARFPRAEITLVGLPWAREIVDRCSCLDGFLEFPGYRCLEDVAWSPARSWEFFQRARAVGYDLAIQMHGDGRKSNGFVARLGAGLSLGYRPPRSGWVGLLDLEMEVHPREHEILRCLRLVGSLGASGSAEMEIPVRLPDWLELEEVAAGIGLDLRMPIIGVHPGARDPEKRWPVERFAAAAERLAAELGAQVAVTGTGEELHLAHRVADAVSAPAFVMAGHTSIGGLAALLSQVKLLVTNDTGVSHLAAAVGAPSVVLFGPTDPCRWAPLDRLRHRPLRAEQGEPISTIPTERVVEESLSLVKRWAYQTS